MSTTPLLMIAFMIGMDVLIWAVIRHYDRTGVILAFPKEISRERTPRWFRMNMLIGWTSLGLCIVFTVVITFGLLIGR